MLDFNVDRFWSFERGTAVTPVNAHNFDSLPSLADKVPIAMEVSFRICMDVERKVHIVVRVEFIVEIFSYLIGIMYFILRFLCIY